MNSAKKLAFLILTMALTVTPMLAKAQQITYLPRGMSFRNFILSDKKGVNLWDLGILQLAAHDFFNVDRETEIDMENGRLDLSTLFDHGTENILLGGEIRNRENIAIFSVARFFGKRYAGLMQNGFSENFAQEIVIDAFHDQLNQSFRKIFGHAMPKPQEGQATMTENLALRTLHDILPSKVVVDAQEKFILDHELFGQHLSVSELKSQLCAPLDGEFEPEFRQMIVPLPGREDMVIDLQERDSSFSQQFNTDFSFEFFLAELADGKYDSGDEVTKQIDSLFAKGLYSDKKTNNRTNQIISAFSRLIRIMPAS